MPKKTLLPQIGQAIHSRKLFTAYLRGNGGDVDTEKKPVIYGDKYRKLPVPIRDGYDFAGWYTKKKVAI